MGPPQDGRALLQDWWRRSRESQWAQYECSKQLMRMHYMLGIPLIILATFAGSAVFATISHSTGVTFRWIVGAVSVIVAVLSGLQTFLKLSDRATAHRVAGADYARMRRLMEERLTAKEAINADSLTVIREKIDQLAERSPAVPAKMWGRVERRLKERT